MNFNDGDEFPSANHGPLLRNALLTYAHTDNLSSPTAAHPRQDPLGKMTQFFHTSDDPIKSYPTGSKSHWHLAHRNKPAKASSTQYKTCPSKTKSFRKRICLLIFKNLRDTENLKTIILMY